MRCKAGDFAVVVKSKAGNEGAIVTCLHFVGEAPVLLKGDDNWLIDRPLRNTWGQYVPYARDSQLCPLRPDEGEDEMLRIAGRPVGTRREVA